MPRTNARDVVLELVRDAGGEWVGKGKLSKAFYFAHLYYADDRPGLLTDWPIVRRPEGPAIHDGDALLGGLVRDGYLAVHLDREGPYPEYRYRLTDKAAELSPPPGDAREAVRKAAEYALPKSAAELSEITHERSRAWKAGVDGEILNIYVDLIPDEQYREGQAAFDQIERALDEAMRGRE